MRPSIWQECGETITWEVYRRLDELAKAAELPLNNVDSTNLAQLRDVVPTVAADADDRDRYLDAIAVTSAFLHHRLMLAERPAFAEPAARLQGTSAASLNSEDEVQWLHRLLDLTFYRMREIILIPRHWGSVGGNSVLLNLA